MSSTISTSTPAANTAAVTATVRAAAIQAASDTHAAIVATSAVTSANVAAAINGSPVVSAKPSFVSDVRAKVEGLKAEVSKFFHAVAELPVHAFHVVVHFVSIPVVAVVSLFKKI